MLPSLSFVFFLTFLIVFFSIAFCIGWTHSRGRLHYSRHRQMDSPGGQQSETTNRHQQAGKRGLGVQPGLQPSTVHAPALQTQPVTKLCRLHQRVCVFIWKVFNKDVSVLNHSCLLLLLLCLFSASCTLKIDCRKFTSRVRCWQSI